MSVVNYKEVVFSMSRRLGIGEEEEASGVRSLAPNESYTPTQF